jgi:TadE-like protein
MTVKPHLPRRERGAAALEFAVTLPLLIVVLMGILGFGALIRLHLVVFTAANDCSVAMSQGGYQSDASHYGGSGESFDWTSAHAAARQILDQAGLSASNSDEIPNGMLSSGDYTALCDTRVFPAAVPRMWFWDTPSIQYQAYNPAQRYRAERWDKYDGP